MSFLLYTLITFGSCFAHHLNILISSEIFDWQTFLLLGFTISYYTKNLFTIINFDHFLRHSFSHVECSYLQNSILKSSMELKHKCSLLIAFQLVNLFFTEILRFPFPFCFVHNDNFFCQVCGFFICCFCSVHSAVFCERSLNGRYHHHFQKKLFEIR